MPPITPLSLLPKHDYYYYDYYYYYYDYYYCF